jgi:hypothetical protein
MGFNALKTQYGLISGAIQKRLNEICEKANSLMAVDLKMDNKVIIPAFSFRSTETTAILKELCAE